MEDYKKELIEILGLSNGSSYNSKVASWAEIFVEIGRLKERASKRDKESGFPIYTPIPNFPNPNITQPLVPVHYHGAQPCYNNPCVWC